MLACQIPALGPFRWAQRWLPCLLPWPMFFPGSDLNSSPRHNCLSASPLFLVFILSKMLLSLSQVWGQGFPRASSERLAVTTLLPLLESTFWPLDTSVLTPVSHVLLSPCASLASKAFLSKGLSFLYLAGQQGLLWPVATVDISVRALGLPVSALPGESLSLKLPDSGVSVMV